MEDKIIVNEENIFSIDFLFLSLKQTQLEQCSDTEFSMNSFREMYTEHYSNSFLDNNLSPSNHRSDVEYVDTEEYISLICDNQRRPKNWQDENCNRIDEKELLRKYFNAWFTLSQNDDLKSVRRQRKEKINEFLNNILKKKNEIKKTKQAMKDADKKSDSTCSSDDAKKSTIGNNSYQHRYKAQQNIIALQKAKLEQQERIIEELRLKKIIEDSKHSEDIISDVRKTLQKCERHVKPTLKFIAGEEHNENQNEDDTFKLLCTRVPKVLQKMEHRAREREEKRAIVRERRRQIEMEKEKAKEQMEIARQQMDQEEKNKRLNEFKEKRRQEQLIIIRNKKLKEKLRALSVMADLHYENKLMNLYGLNAWKMFIWKIKDDYDKAVMHYTHQTLKNNFDKWRCLTVDMIDKRNEIANNMYNMKLWRWVFQQWKKEYKIMINKRQVAEDWYDLHVTERLFIKWRSNTIKIKYQRKKQWELAVHHYDNQLLWKVIGYWQTLPTINTLEREQEARKQRWRLRVQQVLPDFIPRNISDI